METNDQHIKLIGFILPTSVNIIMTNKYCNENLSFLHNSRLHLCSLWKKLIVNDERYQTRRLHAAGFFNRHKTFEAQTWNQNLFYTSSWNRTIKVITKSDWPLGLGGGVIINYSGTVTWEVPFCSCQLFLSCIRGAMNQVSSFGILNKRDQELSLNNVSVYLVVKMNVQLSASPTHNIIERQTVVFIRIFHLPAVCMSHS